MPSVPNNCWRAPRVPHWRKSGATQRVETFAEPHDGEYAADVGEVLVHMYGFKPCDAETKEEHLGNWVTSTTIINVMTELAGLPDAPLSIFRPYKFFMPWLKRDIYNNHLRIAEDYNVDDGLKGEDIVLIVIDEDQQHYFTVLIETFRLQRAVHVFDTLYPRKLTAVKNMLAGMFGPSVFTSDKYNFHNYTAHNMGDPTAKQEGATCGPWSVWIAVAFIFDIHRCRSRRDVRHGRMVVKPMKMSTPDIVGFWKHLTTVNATTLTGGAVKKKKSSSSCASRTSREQRP
jgi:hypothetical protein